LLAGGAASWATVGLAGCPGGDTETDTPPQSTPTDSATPTDTAAPTDTATPAPQPENYVVTAETATGSEGVPQNAGFVSSCSATRKFVPGMQMIFYVGIYDPETGEQLTDEDLDSVVVNVDGGPSVELGWAGDDEENPAEEWGGATVLSDDISTGSYSYTVEISGGDGNFRTVGILEDSFEVIEYDDPSNYIVDAATHWSAGPDDTPDYTNGFVGACAPEREFTTEMDITFVIGIYDSLSGNVVGANGLVDPSSGEQIEDSGDMALDSVTIVSPDGAFDDIELQWVHGRDDENSVPQWNGTLETENLSPGSYPYEVQISDESRDRYDVGIASAQFSIIEVPSN
jgi:hypothetical protein